VWSAGCCGRLVFAAYFRSLKVLLSSDITSASRAMYIRNIRERAAYGAAFLLFDADPYMVIDGGGRLRWISMLHGDDSLSVRAAAEHGINYMPQQS